MPTVLPEGLCLTAITTRANVGDAFVSNKYNDFAEPPLGAVGKFLQLASQGTAVSARPDLQIMDLRGNVDTVYVNWMKVCMMQLS